MFTKNKGFTLVEVMIVVGIIAILAGIFLVGSGQFRASANGARIKADIQKFEALQELYYTRLSGTGAGQYAPSKEVLAEELDVVVPTAPVQGVVYRTNDTQSCADNLPTNLGLGASYCLTR